MFKYSVCMYLINDKPIITVTIVIKRFFFLFYFAWTVKRISKVDYIFFYLSPPLLKTRILDFHCLFYKFIIIPTASISIFPARTTTGRNRSTLEARQDFNASYNIIIDIIITHARNKLSLSLSSCTFDLELENALNPFDNSLTCT